MTIPCWKCSRGRHIVYDPRDQWWVWACRNCGDAQYFCSQKPKAAEEFSYYPDGPPSVYGKPGMEGLDGNQGTE